jgi:UDP-N-acetylmuramoyl-L-alanyl-D-glutamate--2,6-diaminopimelate ligase
MMPELASIVDRLGQEGLLRDPSSPVEPRTIDRITSDSRQVGRGALFCAVRGSAADGHQFLASVAASGASAALVEESNDALDLTQIEVTNSRRSAAFAAAEFYGDPWRDMITIGVTGTNGKTTTVAILRHLLSRSRRTASIGTLGLVGPDGGVVPGTEGLTTPGPIGFAEEVRGLRDSGVEALAMEVSSHALDQERVGAVTFSAAIFTNLTRDHLDYHGTLENYRAAKLKLVDLIRAGGVLATNADDPAWDGVRREGVHLVRFGTQGRGEVQAERIAFAKGGLEWHLSTPSCRADVRIPLFGAYNVYNALGAAAALWGLGWTSDRIAEGLADLPQIPGRLESLGVGAGPQILIDYAHTPDALERALRALRPLVKGRLIVVFGAGGDRDRGKRPEMGRVAAANADLAVVTTDNPRHEDPRAIIREIERGMGSAPRRVVVDRQEAIAEAIRLAEPNDMVLLAGKGHERYQTWGDEQRPFDERMIVAEILKGRGVTA